MGTFSRLRWRQIIETFARGNPGNHYLHGIGMLDVLWCLNFQMLISTLDLLTMHLKKQIQAEGDVYEEIYDSASNFYKGFVKTLFRGNRRTWLLDFVKRYHRTQLTDSIFGSKIFKDMIFEPGLTIALYASAFAQLQDDSGRFTAQQQTRQRAKAQTSPSKWSTEDICRIIKQKSVSRRLSGIEWMTIYLSNTLNGSSRRCRAKWRHTSLSTCTVLLAVLLRQPCSDAPWIPGVENSNDTIHFLMSRFEAKYNCFSLVRISSDNLLKCNAW